jgi:hypothetical protein
LVLSLAVGLPTLARFNFQMDAFTAGPEEQEIRATLLAKPQKRPLLSLLRPGIILDIA